jgi:hypothetical protein
VTGPPEPPPEESEAGLDVVRLIARVGLGIKNRREEPFSVARPQHRGGALQQRRVSGRLSR